MSMEMYDKSMRAFLKPVLKYLDDPTVSEIMINGPEDVWIERKGCLFRTPAKFTPEGVEAAGRNMAQYVGRMIDNEHPRLDARLPDGSRIHVVLPPIARRGTTISIRKFWSGKLTINQMVEFGSLPREWARFIEACVLIKQNIVVSGGTGSGKTTLLNVVSALIPNEERILVIEDSAELQLMQDHLVSFESRPPDKLGRGKIDMGDLLHSALRLRPDRIIVGEVRGGEAFHLMQSMNTGHSGSMCTVHANSPTDSLRRLESLCLMSDVELPMVAIRAQVASAINVVICCARFPDGSRRLTHISEVLPLNDKGDYRTQDMFVYTITGKDKDGRIQGYHAPTGILPTFLSKLQAYGYPEIDEDFFDPATYDLPRPPVMAVHEFKIRWIPRLEDGKEQWKPRPLDPEKKKRLDQVLDAVLLDRPKVPPPTVDFDQVGEAPAEPAAAVAQPGAGGAAAVAAEKSPAPGGENKHSGAGSYARQLLKNAAKNTPPLAASIIKRAVRLSGEEGKEDK